MFNGYKCFQVSSLKGTQTVIIKVKCDTQLGKAHEKWLEM